jgi:hypothetical protein
VFEMYLAMVANCRLRSALRMGRNPSKALD